MTVMAASHTAATHNGGGEAATGADVKCGSSLAGILAAGASNGEDKGVLVGRKRRHSSDSLDVSHRTFSSYRI